jgi:hypothetical protein
MNAVLVYALVAATAIFDGFLPFLIFFSLG